jgi:hypothetical protein
MSSEQDSLKLAAEIVDKFSGPLRQMTKSVHGFQDMLKGAHTEGSKGAKEQAKQQQELNERITETGRKISGVLTPAMAAMGLSIGGAGSILASFIGQLKDAGDHFYRIQGALQATGMSGAGLQTWVRTMGAFGVSTDQANQSAIEMGDTLAKLGRGFSPEIQRIASTFTNLHGLINSMEATPDNGNRVKLFMDYFLDHPAPPDQRRKLLEAFHLPVELAYATDTQLREEMLRQQQFTREHPPIDPDIAWKLHKAFASISEELEGFNQDMLNAFGGSGAKAMEGFGGVLHKELDDIKWIADGLKSVDDWLEKIGGHGDLLGEATTKILHPSGWLKTLHDRAYAMPDERRGKLGLLNSEELRDGYRPISFTTGGSSDPESILTRGVKSGMLAAFREWFASTVSPSGGGGGAGAINASYSPGGGGGAPRFGSKAFPNLGEGGAAAAKRLGLGADPGAGLTGNAYLKAQNKSMADELARDPQTRKELAAMAATEGDAGNVVEALANRKAYLDQATGTNHSVHSLLHSGFYGPINRGALPGALASLARNPKRAAQINAAIDSVLEGRHNALRGATDQGMATDPNGRWPGGRVTGLDQIYNDWGGGPGGHAGAARFRERQQAAVNAAVASAATPHDSFGPLADISGGADTGRMPDIRHAGGGFTPMERTLLANAKAAGDQKHTVEGDASVNVKFENLPAGAKAQMWHGGLFKQGSVDWGHAMSPSNPGGPPSVPISR